MEFEGNTETGCGHSAALFHEPQAVAIILYVRPEIRYVNNTRMCVRPNQTEKKRPPRSMHLEPYQKWQKKEGGSQTVFLSKNPAALRSPLRPGEILFLPPCRTSMASSPLSSGGSTYHSLGFRPSPPPTTYGTRRAVDETNFPGKEKNTNPLLIREPRRVQPCNSLAALKGFMNTNRCTATVNYKREAKNTAKGHLSGKSLSLPKDS